MKQEIERKYTVKYLPEKLEVKDIIEIEQVFIYRDTKTVIRIRKIQDRKTNLVEYIYTVKTNGNIQECEDSNIANVYEIESYISEDEFNKMINSKITNIIRKTRIIIPIENSLNVEMDIYKGYLQDLITAEIEFPNEEIAKKFQKPEWLGAELEYKTLSNWKLSNMTKDEWQSKITKENIKNNQEIIKDLKKRQCIR